MSVTSVVPGGPAAAAGLKAGDRIVELAREEIVTLGDLEQVMGAHEPGEAVPLTVLRDGESLDLILTFGERPGGGVAMGVSLAVMGEAPGGNVVSSIEGGLGRDECLAWVDETYQMELLRRDLGLGMVDEPATIRACMARDVLRMAVPIPFGWCDNVLKVHCSGLDLLTEIGEALIERCEQLLSDSLGPRPDQHKAWATCAADKVFRRYSMNGEASDEAACRAALVECSGLD